MHEHGDRRGATTAEGAGTSRPIGRVLAVMLAVAVRGGAGDGPAS